MTFRSSLVASPRRARNSARSREKEKPAKFANGSLLGNDSRIFVGASRRVSAFPNASLLLPSLFLPVAFLPPISLFQSFTVPRHPVYYHPFTFYFALSRIFGASPLATTLCTLDFVCILDFLSFTYHLGFCNNNASTIPIAVSLYTQFSSFCLCSFFFFFTLSPFLPSRDFVTCPLPCPSRSFVHPRWELSFVSCVADVYSSCSAPIRLPE